MKNILKSITAILLILSLLIGTALASGCGTVYGKSGSSNIRTAPSLYGNDIGTLHKGEYATYLGQTEWDDRGVAWYKISFNGTVGWVSSMYTSLDGSSPRTSTYGSFWTTGKVYIRTGPSLNASSIRTIASGERVNNLGRSAVDERGVTWYYVSWDTVTGWISSKYLR